MTAIDVRVFMRNDARPLRGVRLQLRERRGDQLLGRPVATNDGGRAQVLVPRDLRGVNRLSQLELVVLDHEGEPRLPRTIVRGRALMRAISIPLSPAQAGILGYYRRKPRRDRDQKVGSFCSDWSRKLGADRDGSVRDSLCLTRSLLDLMSGIDSPTGPTQELLADQAQRRLSADDLRRVQKVAARGRERFDSCGFKDLGTRCDGSDPQELAKSIFFSAGGSGQAFMQALSATVPDPRTTVGSIQAGHAFTHPPVFSKGCNDRFDGSALPPLPAAIRDEMRRILEEGVGVLVPPSVNLVEVWEHDHWRAAHDPGGHITRFGEVHDETLTVSERTAPLDTSRKTFNTDVELDDPHCVMLETDSHGRQRFFVDVRPGQVVILQGSGFINASASLRVDLRRLDSVDSEGRLVFRDDWESVAGLDRIPVEVQGSDLEPLPGERPSNYSRDRIVFTWPEAASREGLYRLQLQMENGTRHYLEIAQDPITCELSLVKDGTLSADPLHFIVVPEIRARRVRMVGTEVHCEDETDPEQQAFIPLADDVTYTLTGLLAQLQFDPTQSDPSLALSLADLEGGVPVSEQQYIWDAPLTWSPNLQAFPEDAPSKATLGFDQHATVIMSLIEVDGGLDQAILNAVLIVAAIALVLLILAIVAAAIILLIATGVVAGATLGAGTALTILVAAFAGFLTGAAFTALTGVINMIVAQVPSSETIGEGATTFSGLELAHRMSEVRIHRLFWTAERPEIEDPTASLVRVESEYLGGDYRERFRVENLGGVYEVTIAVDQE